MTGYVNLDLGQLLEVPFDRAAPCLTRDSIDWHADAAKERREAAQACHTCPLLIQCALAAFERRERHGVWGGLDFDESRNARKREGETRLRGRKRRGKARCGTKTGYDRHNRLREPSCPACLRARADYSALMRERKRQTA